MEFDLVFLQNITTKEAQHKQLPNNFIDFNSSII